MNGGSNPSIIYEDNHLLVLNKPSGMPAVPDCSRDYSLLDWGRDYIKKTKNKPGNVFLAVVHRIDRPVSGLVCFARTSKAASRLSKQMREGIISKEYLAVTKNVPNSFGGVVKNYLKKDRKRNITRIASREEAGAKRAITRWQVIGKRKGMHLFHLVPVTGRPHQLRIHLAKVLGCPILGDKKYGSDEKVFEGRALALHSWKLGFNHPTNKRQMQLIAPVPSHFPFKPPALFSDLY